jgi:hypothetical protein
VTTETKSAEQNAAQFIYDSALALANLAAISKFEKLTYLLGMAATEAAEHIGAAKESARRSQ